MLENEADDWSSVLDLYAGSGALGIEALSRGADRADFVEKSSEACRTIQANIERLGLSDRSRIFCQPTKQALQSLVGPYGIILLDPPYADPDIASVLEQISGSALIGKETVVVVEHARSRSVNEAVGPLRLVKERRHGDTVVSIFRRRD